MVVLSCFDGMSCGQIALERAGIKVKKYYASEIDKYAIKVTQANYPNTIQLGSITEWENWNIEQPDMIIGGSPCQGFSFAGKQLNFEDERSKLFFTFAEIIKHYKPKYFLLENVKMKKECHEVITNILGVEPIEINSALVSAQNRKRLYWTNIPNVKQPEDKGIFLKDIVEDIKHKYLNDKTAGRCRTMKNIKSVKEKSYTLTSTMYKMSQNNGMTNIKDDKGVRCITPLECERLQTVPDNYTNYVSNTQRYKMLGNAWTVDVIAHIFRGIRDADGELIDGVEVKELDCYKEC